MNSKKDVLGHVHFGQRIAEQESHLAEYFVETDQWRATLAGEFDVVYGAKGSGKSAIYSLLLGHRKQLEKNGISPIPAENPQGAPVFEDLKTDPPASEREFRGLWKLYFLCLIGTHFRESGVANDDSKYVLEKLEEAQLLAPERTLKGMLHSVLRHVQRMAQAESVALGEIEMDPATGLPKGVIGKITLREPSAASRKLGMVTPDDLFIKADSALRSSGRRVWILLDRLDVVFPDSTELESNALRALFRTYLDCMGLQSISLKLFLRTDIWKRITAAGFREASHVAKDTTIRWHRVSLANLIVRRLLHNQAVVEHYKVETSDVLANSKKQFELLSRILPSMSTEPSLAHPLDWMISRLRDGSGQATPREFIHFLVQAREIQLGRLELGVPEPSEETLFHPLSFSIALRYVSTVRFDQTLCQEYPQWKSRMNRLKGERALLHLTDLSAIWHEPEEKAVTIAENLVEIGFFEPPDSGADPLFCVPYLYRPALGLK